MSKLVAIVAALLAASCAAQRDEIAPTVAEANPASLALVDGTPTAAVGAVDSTPTVAVASVDSTSTVAEPAAVDASQVKNVEIEDFEDTLVCEAVERVGSRMSRKVCYTREEYAAVQEQERLKAQRYARDLARDTEWREQQRREEEQRRSAAALGR